MRFYNGQHRYYCGVDLHTKRMYLCILDQEATSPNTTATSVVAIKRVRRLNLHAPGIQDSPHNKPKVANTAAGNQCGATATRLAGKHDLKPNAPKRAS
jgi:hypothetical protein